MKVNFPKLKFDDKILFRIIGIVVRAILIVGIIAQLGITIFLTVSSLIVSGPVALVTTAIENALLIIVLLEIYLAVEDYLSGKGRTASYVIDASISFIVREIIIDVFNGVDSNTTLLVLAGIVAILSFSRFLTSRAEKDI
ncbi:phosphate-starvation-inducible PsiE family protein [Sulfuracidifex metallicus]|uniref:phosphate-starvation-inducible PsiE family protein n=1 Tax=Sulfuracidifex metallicus TaxID=47303 RepID=UPI0022732815|nr:phosphate-starvation-inducible PsiE family protein [Sulfuracidifex metallicus]MCY0850933.1 phosphate-starvation-inducible PsiE family protein [Sulfuracidifex metallicus]